MNRLVTLSVALFVGIALPAQAQDAASELAVPPPPPGASTADPPPAPSSAVPSPSAAPTDEAVAPLLAAAEQDLAAGRSAYALARATVVSRALPQNRPLRIRADGLRLLARGRLPREPTLPPPDEVFAPLVVQAELDLRAHRTLVATQRLEFALARLPQGSLLRARAEGLREIAYRSMGGAQPAQGVPGYGVPPPVGSPVYFAGGPQLAPLRPRDPDRRGGGEMAELYVIASGLGALTGGFLPFIASDGTADGVTYALTIIGGAGLFAVGAATLDLAGVLRTGIAPTISSSIRFGAANGLLVMGVANASGLNDRNAGFALVWGGAALGAVVGLGVGFGVGPRVPEQRLVESVGIWGGGVGTSIAMLTEYRDAGLALGLSLAGLDIGIAAGLAAVSAGARMPIGRTLFLDLGFLAGYGLGVTVPLLYHYASRTDVETVGLGAGSLIGSVGGWLLLYFLTEGMGVEEADAAPEDPRYTLGLSPVEGGAVVSFSGLL